MEAGEVKTNSMAREATLKQRVCEISDGCLGRMILYRREKMLCSRHYCQMQKRGKILEKTRQDRNDFIMYSDYIELILMDNLRERETGRAKIDKEKLEDVLVHKWHLSSNGYANTRIKGRVVGLHRLVKGNSGKLWIDHKNGDKLDNRMENLRFATPSENAANKKATRVYFYKPTKSWNARVYKDGKQVYSRYFKEREVALTAQRKAHKIFYGEYAFAN